MDLKESEFIVKNCEKLVEITKHKVELLSALYSQGLLDDATFEKLIELKNDPNTQFKSLYQSLTKSKGAFKGLQDALKRLKLIEAVELMDDFNQVVVTEDNAGDIAEILNTATGNSELAKHWPALASKLKISKAIVGDYKTKQLMGVMQFQEIYENILISWSTHKAVDGDQATVNMLMKDLKNLKLVSLAAALRSKFFN